MTTFEGGMGALVAPPLISPRPAEPGLTDGNAPLRRKGDPHLRSVNDTTHYHVVATDGAIGPLEDFLIDDDAWRVRYLVIDTRNWLPGKKVIVAPGWIREMRWETRTVHVDLDRDAIRASPPYDTSAPWNPAYPAELHDHYGRPRYSDWDGENVADAPKPRRGE